MATVDMTEALQLQAELTAQGWPAEVGLILAKATLGDEEAMKDAEDLARYLSRFEVDVI